MFNEFSTSIRFDSMVVYDAVMDFYNENGDGRSSEIGQAIKKRYSECGLLYEETMDRLISEMGDDLTVSNIKCEDDAVCFTKDFVLSGKNKLKHLEDIHLYERELDCLLEDVTEFYKKCEGIRTRKISEDDLNHVDI